MTREKIGYCRPPKTSQFKPGKSGNPRGRPKGSTNLATDLSAELGEKITVREAGRPHRVSKQRALIKSLMAKALQGDVRAAATVLALHARIGAESIDDKWSLIGDDELQILRRFAPRLLKSLANVKGQDDEDR
jgi:hypothetical protein